MTRTRACTRHILPLIGVLLLALAIVAPYRVAAEGPDPAITSAQVNAASAVFLPSATQGTVSSSRNDKIVAQTDAALKICQVALNVAADTTETTATIAFDTCRPVNALVNIAQRDNPPPFGNGQALDSLPTTHHVLTLANLEPATAYLFHISDGMGNDIGDGSFVTRLPQITNLRAQPGTTSVEIRFDLDVPVATAIIIRGPDGERGTALDPTQHVYLYQAGLRPGTSYTYTVLVHGLYLTQGSFKTGVRIDNGSVLNPASN